jgi:hypothetical protein
METLYEIMITPRAQKTDTKVARKFLIVTNKWLTNIMNLSDHQVKFKVKILKTHFNKKLKPNCPEYIKEYLKQIPDVIP